MHCTSYQPISVANLGWSVNDVKPWYHRVYKICVFPRQPFTPWVRQWKRPFCAWVLPKITYNEITRQFIYCHYLLTSWCRFQWRRSAAARLLGLWVRIPQGAWMSVVILCVIRWKSLRRADPSSRGVLPTVMRRCMLSRNFVNEEALAHWELGSQKPTNKQTSWRIPARKFFWPGAGAVKRNIRYPQVDMNPNPLCHGSGG